MLVGWLNQENRAAAFGGRIKQLRRQQELTLRKLSEKAGISYSLSHAIERGELLPTEEAVLSIARALGQHKPDELLALAGYGREQGKAD
ncbi:MULTISPECIES: helix-turn-helix domain-containing protein [unclassified Paenibacillus]|uniref:helix-turn-helix domain-containing protein n=1 Tax=unclassified Paenibacillus TaxID=185978 RepID=UPI00210B35C1|nr:MULTISPECIES: helix-turn-helix transcriptional regulator [unclassified Paenibacillus]